MISGRSILQKSKGVFFADEESCDLTFKSYEELVTAYEKQGSLPVEVVKEAINNTNVLANMIEEFNIDRTYKYPHLWENPMKTFQNKIMQGIKKRGVDKYPNYQEYIDRIKHELKAYEHNGAIDFMLLFHHLTLLDIYYIPFVHHQYGAEFPKNTYVCFFAENI